MAPSQLETDPRDVLQPDGFEDTAWATALAEDDPDRARSALVGALRTGGQRTSPETDFAAIRRRWLGRDPGYDHGFDLDPELVVDHHYVGAYGVAHRFEGGIDWFYNPTADREEHDFTGEWQWQLNRHYQWIPLADAYRETGDARYADAFEAELRSWVEQCPRPDHSGNEHPSAWRTIEAGIRAGWVWPYAFETFRRSDDVSDEALWLMVCSFRDHGIHLLWHLMSHNWKTMETSGLAHVGAMFPELDGSGTFLSTAIDRAVAELERQFYPDGLQQELAPSYGGGVSLGNLYSTLELASRRAGAHPAGRGLTVPDRARKRLRVIATAYGRLAAPDGRCPPLNDSPYIDARPAYRDVVDDVDPPWASGESDHLRWGGYGILRRGDRYALLDAGPYGAGHQHQDTLQVVGVVDDDWLVIDPGGPQYTQSPVTAHLRSAAAHNVVLLDGERHEVRPSVLVTDEPLPVALAAGEAVSATAATRSFETDDAGVVFDHERVLCDVDDVGWVVFDRLEPRDDDAHAFEWLWGTPGSPTVDGDVATVTGGEDPSVSQDCGPRLRVEPVGSEPVTTAVVSAQGDPYRGWQPTGESGDPGPLPTVRVETAPASGPVSVVTLLSPAGAAITEATVAADAGEQSVTLQAGDGARALRVARGDDGDVEQVAVYGDGVDESCRLSGHSFLAD